MKRIPDLFSPNETTQSESRSRTRRRIRRLNVVLLLLGLACGICTIASRGRELVYWDSRGESVFFVEAASGWLRCGRFTGTQLPEEDRYNAFLVRPTPAGAPEPSSHFGSPLRRLPTGAENEQFSFMYSLPWLVLQLWLVPILTVMWYFGWTRRAAGEAVARA